MPADRTLSRPLRPWGETVALTVLWSLLILGVPFLLAQHWIAHLVQGQVKLRQEATFKRLDLWLERLQPFADPEWYLPRFFFRLARQAETQPAPLPWLEKRLQNLARRKPALGSYVVFDREGKVHCSVGGHRTVGSSPWGAAGGIPRRVAESLQERIRSFLVGVRPQVNPLPPLMKEFLGTPRSFVEFEKGNGWALTSHRPHRSWFFYHPGERFTLFARLDRQGVEPMAGLRTLLARRRRGTPTWLVDTSEGKSYGPAGGHSNLALRVVGSFEQEPETHFSLEGRLWAVLPLDNRFRLVASVPATRAEEPSRLLRRSGVILGVIFGALSLLTLPVMRGGWRFGLSIAWKLPALFLLTAGLPLGFLAMLGTAVLSDRREALEEALIAEAFRRLQDVDAKMPIAFRRAQTAFRRLLSRTALPALVKAPSRRKVAPNPGKEDFLPRFTAFQKRFGCNDLKIIDLHGQCTLLGRGRIRSVKDQSVLDTLLLEILFSLNPGARPTDDPRHEARLHLFSTLAHSIDDLVDDAIGHLGRFFLNQAGGATNQLFADVIAGPDGKPTHLLSFSWEGPRLVWYCVRQFFPVRPLEDGTRLFAVSASPVWVPGPGGTGRFPFRARFRCWPRTTGTPSLMAFLDRLRHRNQPVADRLILEGTPVLAVGRPGGNLDGTFLLAIRPLRTLTDEIGQMRRHLLAFLGYMALFTTSMGWFFARTVLLPLREVSSGLEAIRQRRFSYRIPPQTPDELGQLSDHLNRTMEGLAEMSQARRVQEGLFPVEVVVAGDYTAAGRSVPASDLGGDFFDYRRFDGHHLLVLLGDVTGHGTPAAIILAMAKAVFSAQMRAGRALPDILQTLNDVIHDDVRFHPRLGMTFCALTLDTRTHELTLYNCGHPYPFVLGGKGGCTPVKSIGIPLGISARFRVTPVALRLEPGERLLLYSDGLMESLVTNRRDNGFLLWQKYVSAAPHLGLAETCRELLGKHPALAEGPPPDDCTVVLVERSPSPRLRGEG